MSYDPFARGPHPVGVRTATLTDSARAGRTLPLELWYPATDAARGLDTEPGNQDQFVLVAGLSPWRQAAVRDATARPGPCPLVVFSHGYGSHRRQSTYLCTHLASHGYAVVAADHVGNSTLDLLARAAGDAPQPIDPRAAFRAVLADRLDDVALLAARADELLDVDGGAVAVAGHSLGGWTALAAAPRQPRIAAVVALAPAGGRAPEQSRRLAEGLGLPWPRAVPVTLVVADDDSVLSLASMRQLYEVLAPPKRLAVLLGTDHAHFCDEPEQNHALMRAVPMTGVPRLKPPAPYDALCPGEQAHDAVCGLALAQLDAALTGRAAARALLDARWSQALRARGIAVEADQA